MASDFIVRHRKHLIISMALLLLTLFLVGSGRATSTYLDREAKAGAERQHWQNVAAGIGTELPIERANEWRKLSSGQPRIFVEANTLQLTPVSAEYAAEEPARKGAFGRLLLCMFDAKQAHRN